MGITKVGNKWRARYTINGVRYNVGTFKTKKEAMRAISQHMWDNNDYPGFIIETPTISFFNKINIIQRIKNAISDFRANSSTKK